MYYYRRDDDFRFDRFVWFHFPCFPDIVWVSTGANNFCVWKGGEGGDWCYVKSTHEKLFIMT